MKTLIRWTLLTFLIVVMLIGMIFLSLSRRTPQTVAVLLPDDACDSRACWQGVQPSNTALAEAETLLTKSLPLQPLATPRRWVLAIEGKHHEVRLIANDSTINILPDDTRLGDLLAALGEPTQESLQPLFDPNAIPANVTPAAFAQIPASAYVLELFYPVYRLYVSVVIDPKENITPQTPVRSMLYYGEESRLVLAATDWQGWGMRQRLN